MPCPARLLRVAPAALLLAFTMRAEADELHFHAGHVMEGKVTVLEGAYRIETGAGTSRIPADRVARLVRKPTTREIYALRAAALADDDFDGHLALGDWCRREALPEEARWHFMKAVALRPDHEEARRKAGFVRVDGKWFTHAERKRREGLRKVNGEWLPAPQAERERAKEDRRAREETAYETAWPLLMDARRVSTPAGRDALAERLAALGPAALPALRRGAGDPSPAVRRLAARVLAELENGESREVLLHRLRVEDNRDVLAYLLDRLAQHPDRLPLLEELLKLLLASPGGRDGARATAALRRLGDPRAVETLLPRVEESLPAPAAASNDPAADPDGEEAPAVYPFHEALRRLTGELLPPEREAWAAWWRRRANGYAYPPVELAPPRNATARRARDEEQSYRERTALRGWRDPMTPRSADASKP